MNKLCVAVVFRGESCLHCLLRDIYAVKTNMVDEIETKRSEMKKTAKILQLMDGNWIGFPKHNFH